MGLLILQIFIIALLQAYGYAMASYVSNRRSLPNRGELAEYLKENRAVRGNVRAMIFCALLALFFSAIIFIAALGVAWPSTKRLLIMNCYALFLGCLGANIHARLVTHYLLNKKDSKVFESEESYRFAVKLFRLYDSSECHGVLAKVLRVTHFLTGLAIFLALIVFIG